MWNAVDKLLLSAMETGCFPGCAIAAGQRGEVLYQKTFGHLMPHGSAAVAPNTRYDAGSLTQVLATMPLALKAMESGLISPDDPIARFLPQVPQDKREITLEQLLTHTSGLPASFSLEHEAHGAGDALRALLAHPLESQPGTKVRQSAMGYILLGYLMEKIFDLPLDTAVKRLVTQPLGMSGTGYLPSGEGIAPNRIADESAQHEAGYPLDGNARFLHGIAGHAGLFTTIADLTRFVSMLAADGTCGQEVFLAQRSVHLAATDRTRGMNAAWSYSLRITKRSQPYLGHLWPSDGYGLQDPTGGSLVAVNPSDGFFVALLCNGHESPASREENDRLRKVLLNAAYAAFQHQNS
ncbi:MAG: beta-lactamase family protein [Clostridiales bacterium]|nr:beta-lactamase family protein [Clostridiales bacterium]